ncbi:MAG: 5,10-methylenetetrahydrofolate reductase, partial [Propionibacteriales bacterium]|nr:5,10-methylenetetrahydrofolate reductase [Propionibacteriales bacterium]
MVLGLSSHWPGGAASIRELLALGDRSFSFEFFPPKDDEGERVLWTSIRELEALHPTFVSVTYGAGGSTRDRTVRITEAIAGETTLTPVGHLTGVDHSRAELRAVIGSYAAAGVRNLMLIRGDPPGGPGHPWVRHPDGIDHAVELVEMVRELGDFCVGVGAFPEGHPEAASLEEDARVLADKAAVGADFAVTQLFFRASDYFGLLDRLAAIGCDIPVIPGIMPILNLRQVRRMAELSGADVPADIVRRLESYGDDRAAVRAAGIELATGLCDELLAGGA